MALPSIMVAATDRGYQQETFEFEHAMAHRNLYGVMATEQGGLSRFSVLPYRLDPGYRFQGGWLLDHGQAHSDFSETLPGSIYVWDGIVIGQGPPEYLTLGSAAQYADSNLANPEVLNWWVFQNHSDHLTAETVVPLQQVQYFPFW